MHVKNLNNPFTMEIQTLFISLANVNPKLEYTRPITFYIGEKVYRVSAWKHVLNILCDFLYSETNGKNTLNALVGKKCFVCTRRICIVKDVSLLVTPVPFGDGLFIETNFSATSIFNLSREIAMFCNIDLASLRIEYYIPNQNELSRKEIKQNVPQRKKMIVLPERMDVFHSDYEETKEDTFNLSNEIMEQNVEVILILEKHFTNGFRVNSPIELSRFCKFAREYEFSVAESTEMILKEKILNCGHYFEGKVYVIMDETKERIKRYIDEAIANNVMIFYYESFFEKYSDWLLSVFIASAEILKSIFLELFPHLSHKKNYMTLTRILNNELSIIETEIQRVWGDDIVLSYEQLVERLPYIPLAKIQYCLGSKTCYVRSETGVYTYLDKLDMIWEEREAIVDFARQACDKKGYALLREIPHGTLKERYPEISHLGLCTAMFRKCLADGFEVSGQIITFKGANLNCKNIITEYCRSKDSCSLDELLDIEKELLGRISNSYALEAGYEVFVRVSKDLFLAERHFEFDIAAIDEAIEQVMTHEYKTLKSFISFAMFPYCGRAWNLFLLESYCRKFSNRFRFDAPAVNSKNAGVVIRKENQWSYEAIMVDAIIQSKVELHKKSVEAFLYDEGYIGKRASSKTDDIIEQVKKRGEF